MTFSPAVEAGLRAAKARLWDAHGPDQNSSVTGMGLSFRRKAGAWTDEPVVSVMVAKKRPAAYVSRRRLLPTTVEGEGRPWGVDVIQGGPFAHRIATDTTLTPTGLRPALINSKMRPPRQGCSISNINDGVVAGTLTGFVADKTDGHIALLSCNHVIARLDDGGKGEHIIQPGKADLGPDPDLAPIAYLKRWWPLNSATVVDGAIAELVDQHDYTNAVAYDKMLPVSQEHPAVGIVVAGDWFGNCFLTRMDTTLTTLGVSLLVGDPPRPADAAMVVAPEWGVQIDKVGRTSEYTSSTIVGVGFTVPVVVDEQTLRIVLYSELIWTEYFDLPGDSGSLVCVGGPGDVLVPPEDYPCTIAAAAEDYYGIPLTDDEGLADTLRDDFLSQSLVGRLMISTTYINSDTVIARWKSRDGTFGQNRERAYAPQYYAKYHDYIATVLNDPTSTAVVTQENLDDIHFILVGEAEVQAFTPDEARAATYLYNTVIAPTLGMNRQQIIEYLNDQTVYQQVYDKLSTLSTIELTGPVSPTAH
jgi:hypothetical protein